jgi:arabinan endo-1,5-alpha-L-arabinosidase
VLLKLKISPAALIATLVIASCGARADADATVAGRTNISAHDPSTIVICKDEYWVFATGRGIVSFHSTNLIHWTPGPPVFTTTPSWTTNAVPGSHGRFWAPDVIHLGSRYLLFYAVSTWGQRTSAIGLAETATLDPNDPKYLWKDDGVVIQTSPKDDFNAIDPAVCLTGDDQLWLAFGSFWSGIKLVRLDPATGKRTAPDSPLYALAHAPSIEASYIYPHAGHYYLFVNWGLCCRGIRSTYNIRVGRSDRITGPYLDKDGADLLMGGGSLVLDSNGPFIGPGHAGIITAKGRDWLSCHFYDGTRGGAPTLAVLPLTWNAAGWPKIEVTQP